MNPTRTVLSSLLLVSTALAFSTQASAEPSFHITQTADIAAGHAAMGPTHAVFDWTVFFAPGTAWTPGGLPPSLNGPSGILNRLGGAVFAAAGSSLHLGNWIDGNGFDPQAFGFNAANGSAAPELAINGAESFSLEFAAPVTTVGLAISTGLSNLPSEVDHAGAVFQVHTDSGGQGTLTLADAGTGHSAWVSFSSDTPFTALTLTELSGAATDQYFGNVFAPVPEPGSLALMALGLSGLAARFRRR